MNLLQLQVGTSLLLEMVQKSDWPVASVGFHDE
jgi:hypothetical protein